MLGHPLPKIHLLDWLSMQLSMRMEQLYVNYHTIIMLPTCLSVCLSVCLTVYNEKV